MSINYYLDFLRNVPPEFVTMLVAMSPIGELRIAIPIALEIYNLQVTQAVFWSVVGNIIPAVGLVLWLDKLANSVCKRSKLAKQTYDWCAARTKRKFETGHLKYGAGVALAIFVGIPLPMTGAWTGALAAFIFGVPKKIALISIIAGIFIAAAIVTLADLGVVRLFNLF